MLPFFNLIIDNSMSIDYNSRQISNNIIQRKEGIKMEQYRDALIEQIKECLRWSVESNGRLVYSIYIWSDGEITFLEQVKPARERLKARDAETRILYYVGDIKIDDYWPWDSWPDEIPEENTDAYDEALKEIYDNTYNWYLEDYEHGIKPDEIVDDFLAELDEREAY